MQGDSLGTQEGEYLLLDAITRGLVKAVHAVANCRVCEIAAALELIIATSCKCPINPINNPDLVYSYSVM
jgi:hypothetical protein